MKKITILLLFFMVQSLIGQNLIKNGDFEADGVTVSEDPIPWAGFKNRAILETGSTDNFIGEVEQGDGSLIQIFDVELGKQYDISFNYKWKPTGEGGSGTKTMTVTLKRNDTNANLSTLVLTDSETWTPGSFSFTSSFASQVKLTFFKGSGRRPLFLDDVVVKISPTKTWNGSLGSIWLNADNWTPSGVPTGTDIVSIPKIGVTNFPTAAGAVTVDKIIIEAGASMIANASVTADVTYNVDVADTDWHLISSPITAEGYDDDWNLVNSINRSKTPGFTDNRAIATYQNATTDGDTGQWTYLQNGGSGTFNSGQGYTLKRNVSGTYSFTGTFTDANVTPTITQGAINNWNLLANPFTSNLDVDAFLTLPANATAITDTYEAIYVWDGSAYVALTTGFIQPGQAFFVNSDVASTTVALNEDMQSHTTGTFYRGASPKVTLSLSNGTSTKTAEINYLENKTKGLDPRFDVGMFDGVASDLRVYTQLLENNEGISFTKQALPNSDIETMVIPVGLQALAGQEIIFTATSVNLVDGINIYLEDRLNSTFTQIDAGNSFKFTTSQVLNGVGRFYLHTTAQSVLSANSEILESVSIYKTNAATLRIASLPQGKATVSLFNVLGKQVLNSSFNANGNRDISLSKFAKGIYIVQLTTQAGKLNKKIILE